MMRRARKKSINTKMLNKDTKKYIVIFAISLACIILGCLVWAVVGGFFDKMSQKDESWEAPPEQAMVPVDDVSGIVNVLILGVDKDGMRTDTIIVASYDTDNGKVNMLSIPRDTRMYIGSKYRKINEAHAMRTAEGKIKGPNGTVDAVTRLTGIPINYYVEFSFDAFRETIDALGGVYFKVPQRMLYRDSAQGLYINLYPDPDGKEQLLDGDKAEQLVRFRQYPQGDIKRVEVQQDFIRAVAEQKLNPAIVTKIPDLYNTLSKNIKTNFGLDDVVKYAGSLLKIDKEDIVMYSLPGEYSGEEYSASYWLPNMKEIKLLVQNTFHYDTKNITSGKAISGVTYGVYTTEELKPKDVVVLQSDKYASPKPDDTGEEASDDGEDKNNKKDKTDKEDVPIKLDSDDADKEKEENASENDEEDEKVEKDAQESVKPDDTNLSEVTPIEPIIPPEEFVRPGANKEIDEEGEA